MDTDSLYELRMLVFLENEPQSNKYSQVILNNEQFKKLSDCIAEIMGGNVKNDSLRNNYVETDITLSEENYWLPDLQSINE